MKKDYTYKFTFWCFVGAALIVLFTALTSCSPKVVMMPTAPVHPQQPEWSLAKKTIDPTPQKAIDEKEDH
jgi:hypothetical protein